MKPSPRPVSEQQLDAMWREAAPRVVKKLRRRRALARAAAGGVALLALLAVAWNVRQADAPRAMTVGPGLWDGPTAGGLVLADDSVVTLAPQARLLVATDERSTIELELVEGHAAFAVTKKRPDRSFVVRAADVEVRVVGTRFSIERKGPTVGVTVDEGMVEVRYANYSGRLAAGSHWQTDELDDPAGAPDEDETPGELESANEAEPPAEAKSSAPSTPLTHRSTHRVKHRAAAVGPRDADALFEAGRAARQAGQVREAAAAWRAFLDAAPHDSRAGMASFELGRLEMDMLSRPRAAERSLLRVLEVAPNAPFADDALARLIRLASDRHDAAATQELCGRYMKRFASGAHSDTVRALCP